MCCEVKMLELKEGIVARIVNDEFPENIGKRVYLRHRPGSELLTTVDVGTIDSWVIYPVDDIIASYPNKQAGSRVAKGMVKTYLFHIIVFDKDIEALESDNTGEEHLFKPSPLQVQLEKGVGDNVTH